ncbi:hypothetical protein [Streptomyces sp. NPDC058620]|uniref:hypothetical protein n=1 Tax=Streptomyces sp. NPDC058620 TaxID=3346560 RepID=UPI003669257E
MNPTLDRDSTPAPGRHHRRLVSHLITLKERSGRSFAQLAVNSPITGGAEGIGAVSATTLKRAVDLKRVPGERAVTAYVRACGVGGDQEALGLWRAARAEDRGRLGRLGRLRAPEVHSIRTRADLAAALAAAYEGAGAPVLRVLQERAAIAGVPGPVLLPLTTAWRTARREGLPTTWKQCEAFLRGCGIPARHMSRWKDAWERATAGRTAVRDRFQTRTAPGAPAHRGRTPSSALVNWTPEMEQSTMATMKALASFVEDLKPKMEKSAMALGKAMGPAHDTMKPQLERSAMAVVNALATLLRSSDPLVRHAALTQSLARAVETIAHLNGIGPPSSHSGQLNPV